MMYVDTNAPIYLLHDIRPKPDLIINIFIR